MKRLLFAFCLLLFRRTLCAEPSLEAYLANELELKRLALEVKKAQLSSSAAAISSGINVTLSTGQTVFRFTDDGTDISFEPSATASIPQVQNLSLKVSTERDSEDGVIKTQNTSLSLSVDVISGSPLKRRAELLSAERSLLEAKRSLQNRALEADMKASFDAGIITQAEYLSAQANHELYRIKLLMNEMDAIIYNNTTKLLFCRDEELQE